ncbi:MAG: hypothetical protein ACYDEN_02340 [Acidimicrobiales bacterium]
MTCPWCGFRASLRLLQAHLVEAHPEQVAFERRGARQVYAIRCPVCGAGYDQTIKPRLDDPTFVEEFQQEIRLVAFDMLLNHLVGEHEPAATSGEEGGA